jgi:hypothetical protein
MPWRRFPKPWTVESIPAGYRVIDANGIALAYVYGQRDGAIAVSDTRLTRTRPAELPVPGFQYHCVAFTHPRAFP